MKDKEWKVYYWNKHEYCWKYLRDLQGKDARQAIKTAVHYYPEFVARGDVLRVEEMAA